MKGNDNQKIDIILLTFVLLHQQSNRPTNNCLSPPAQSIESTLAELSHFDKRSIRRRVDELARHRFLTPQMDSGTRGTMELMEGTEGEEDRSFLLFLLSELLKCSLTPEGKLYLDLIQRR